VCAGLWLHYRKETEKEWKVEQLGAEVSSHTIQTLACGTNYQFRLVGSNMVGQGEPSELLTVKTNGDFPGTPKLTEVLDGNGTIIRIDLNRWSDGGCPISSFYIEYKSKQSHTWQRVYRRDNHTRVFMLPTEEGMKYDVRISVQNDAGSSTKTFTVESIPGKFYAFFYPGRTN